MSLKLQNPIKGETFYRIYEGKVFIGRVYKDADGDWIGKIGPEEEIAESPEAAFREIGARRLGHKNYADLRAHNSAVRSATRQARAASRANAAYVVDQFYRGNDKPFFDLLGKIGK